MSKGSALTESLMYTREGTLDEVEIERHGMLTRIASFTTGSCGEGG